MVVDKVRTLEALPDSGNYLISFTANEASNSENDTRLIEEKLLNGVASVHTRRYLFM